MALDFALTHPARVWALVLIDTVLNGYHWSDEIRARDKQVFQCGREAGIAAAKESWRTHFLFAPAMENGRVAPRLNRMIDDYSGWHFVHRDVETPLQPRTIERLAALEAPTLVLVGERDLDDFHAIAALLEQKIQGRALSWRPAPATWPTWKRPRL